MSFMHIVPLVGLTVLAGIMFILTMLMRIEPSPMDISRKAPIIWGLMFAFFLTWIIGASIQPKKIDSIRFLEIKSIESPDGQIQIAWYIPRSGSPEMLNLNTHFGCQLNSKYKIKHTRYSYGPYCGVSYCVPELKDRFEVIKPEDQNLLPE